MVIGTLAHFLKRAVCALAATALGAQLAMAFAQEPAPAPSPAVDAGQPVQSSEARQRADGIRALMAGELPVDVDIDELFAGEADDQNREAVRLTLWFLEDPVLREQAAESGIVEDYDPDAVELALAQTAFLALSEADRDALIQSHAERQSAARSSIDSERDLQELLTRTRERADAIESFLAGQPTDPALLEIDLLGADAALLDPARRSNLLGEPATATPEEDGAEQDAEATDQPTPEQELAEEIARLDAGIGRYLALSESEYERLLALQSRPDVDLATVAEAEAQAEEAARLAAEAAADAERAATEAARLVAQERGRMLEVRQAQSQFEAQLAGRSDVGSQLEEETLRYRREVRELETAARFSGARAATADQLYAALVEDLKDIRQRLSAALSANGAAEERAPAPPELDPGLTSNLAGGDEVAALRQELLANAARLVAADSTMRAQERAALYRAMLDLNDTRLSMISELSAGRRSEIVGFGEAGIAQVGRELNQIALIARYSFANAGELAGEAVRPILNPTPGFVFGLVQVALLVLVFRIWRSSGDGVLLRLQRSYAAKRPATMRSAFIAAALSYLRDVRRPLEWLVFAIVLRWLVADLLPFPGRDIVWTIIIGGLAAISLVALADRFARTSKRSDPWAQTRVRSLQLIAGSIAGVALLLVLSAEMVGRGAIYSWILSACWLLAPVVAVILSWWWRERIVSLAEAAPKSDLILSWAARNPTGILGHVSRLFAGAVLLFRGGAEIVKSRIKDIALIREITDQRSERQAAQQAAADEASGRYVPIDDEQYEALAPHSQPVIADPAARAPGELDLPKLTAGKIIAVVGERGLGKTTALTDLMRGAEVDKVIALDLQRGGLGELFDELAAALDVPADERSILDGIEATQPSVIVIDNFQRLFVPAIGGLRQFDRFVTMARTCASSTAWVFGIGGPAMAYINRARSDHSLFDEVVTLPRWDASELRALIERRTKRLSITPVFDLRNEAALSMFNSDLTPEERVKRAYFEKLEDLSKGNPAIALEIWRQSLMKNRFTGQVEVRTYSGPPADDLAAMPEATLFVLRAMMQMEVATLDALRWSTDLDAGLISEAIRRLLRHEVISEFAGGYRIRLYWYRSVERVLERRNLMVRAAA